MSDSQPQPGNGEISYTLPPAALSGASLWTILKFFGPGAVIASVTIGSGETLFASRTGAIFGYTLMWFVVFCAICKGVQVYTAARYMTLTGEHPMESWARLPGPRGWFPAIMAALTLICCPFWLSGLPLMLGTAMNWVFGMSPTEENAAQYLFYARLWGTGTIALAIALTLLQSYSFLEKAQTVIVFVLLGSIFTGAILSPTDWMGVLKGLTLFQIPELDAWVIEKYPEEAQKTTVIVLMVTFMGAIGGGTYDYIGYLGFFREKGWGGLAFKGDAAVEAIHDRIHAGELKTVPLAEDAENIERGKRWLRAPQIDVGVSFACVLVFTLAFVILGAAILRPDQLVPSGFDLLSHQAMFLTQFGEGFKYVYQVGVIMAFWGTIYGAYEMYTRTTYECLLPLSRKLRGASYNHFRPVVLVYCGVFGLALMWSLEDPIKLVAPAAILGGALTCGVWCFAMVWADRNFLPKPFQMSRLLLILNLLAGTALTAFGAKAMYDYLSEIV
jgi:hypothetical protein